MPDSASGKAVRDALVLYELALSIGQGESPREDARHFLRTLATRKNLAYASVWLNAHNDPDSCELLVGVPAARSRHPRVHTPRCWLDARARGDWLRIAAGDAVFSESIAESDVTDGVFAVFPLQDIGFLKLYAHDRAALDVRELNKLRAVVGKFAGSLAGSLATVALREALEREKDLRGRLEFADMLVNHSHDPVYGLDVQDGFRIAFANDAACAHLGRERAAIHALRVPDFDPQWSHDDLVDFVATLREADGPVVFETRHYNVAGREIPVEVSATLVEVGAREYIVGYISDISERLQAEQQIRHLAFHDPLTHLPNRRLFTDRLDQHFQKARRYGELFALLLLDLDHFKEINDAEGHPVGDRYLQEIARCLNGAIRESDTLARIGGDEFAIIQGHVDGVSAVAAFAEKLLDSVKGPLLLEGRRVAGAVSIGIAVCDGQVSGSPDDLLSRADVALYAAKNGGRHRYQFYEGEMRAQAERESILARRLAMAVHDHALTLVYQPQFDLRTGELIGFEALIRWRDDELGDVSPTEFIPVAERRGLIDGIGLWVVEKVCNQAAIWLEAGLVFGKLAFNVSRSQLNHPRHMERLVGLIESAAAPKRCLEIEITETAFNEAGCKAIGMLEDLHEKGVSLVIDDFGTGYSSLVALRQFKSDKLKIDAEFVRDMLEDSNDAAIVRGVIALADSLQIRTLAEGVETEPQRQFLREAGCGAAQGFLLAKPMTCEQIERRFIRSRRAASG